MKRPPVMMDETSPCHAPVMLFVFWPVYYLSSALVHVYDFIALIIQVINNAVFSGQV